MAESKSLEVLKKPSSEVRSGPLDLVQKGKKTKNYHVVLSSTSPSGVARLELYEDVKHSLSLQPLLTLVAQDVIKAEMVNFKGKENAFLISTKDQHYTFLTRNAVECSTWLKSIQNILLIGTKDARPFQGARVVTEDNDLYETCDVFPQSTEFIVKVDEDTQDKMKMKGNVRLMVENGNITISNLLGKMIVQWTIKHIRRFGRKDQGIFFLEAGRRSTLGPGIFSFVTEQAESIMAAVDKTKNVKERPDGPRYPRSSMPYNSAPPAAVPKGQPKPASYEDKAIYEEVYIPSSLDLGPNVVQEGILVQSTPPTKAKDVPQHQGTEAKNQVQEPTYDDPTIITDAWKSNGRDEDSDIYSALVFPTPNSSKREENEEEDHYYMGHRSQQPAEDIYAAVDFSKKKNKIQQ